MKGRITYIALIMVAVSFISLYAESDEAAHAYLKGDFKTAIKILESKNKKGEAGIRERIILARSYIHINQSGKAQEVLKSVLKTDNENPEANSLYGQLLFENNKFNDAVPYLKKAVKLKEDPTSLSLLGRCYYKQGNFAEAAAELKKALIQDIRNPLNGYILGMIYLKKGYGMRAEQYLLKAQTGGMKGEDIVRALGRSYLLQHKYIGPVTEKSLTGKKNLGHILEDGIVLGEVPGRINTYYISSTYSGIFNGYHLLKLSPKDIYGLHMVCEGWLASGNHEKAVSFLEKIHQYDRDSSRLASLEARVLLAKGDIDVLDKHLSRSLKKENLTRKETAKYYYKAGLHLQALGKKDEAIKRLIKAEEVEPASEKVIRALAEIHKTGGNIKDAILYYTRFIEYFPDAEDIQEMRNKLNTLKDKGNK